MQNLLKLTDAFKIYPYYPAIMMIPLYDEIANKYAVMIVEKLESNKEGKTLFSLKKATYDSEEQAIFATTRAIQLAMNTVKVMMN